MVSTKKEKELVKNVGQTNRLPLPKLDHFRRCIYNVATAFRA